MKKPLLLSLVLLIGLSYACSQKQPAEKPASGREFYELKIYHVSNKAQESRMDSYLKDAYIPVAHKAGSKDIGVFKLRTLTESDSQAVHVLTPFSSLEDFESFESKLLKDQAYQSAGADYINAAYDDPTFARYEVILLKAFEKHPKYSLPELSSPKADRVYELRSYESATEKLYHNKVSMFNDGDEVGLFDSLGFNAVFYGEVLSGTQMPNLMYLTTHNDSSARAANWDNFVNSAHWKRLIGDPQYANNMNKIDISFLYPTEYSDY